MRVYTFTYVETDPEGTVEEAIAALKIRNLTVDDLDCLAQDSDDSGISVTFTVEDK
jgi:hypothetical protein